MQFDASDKDTNGSPLQSIETRPQSKIQSLNENQQHIINNFSPYNNISSFAKIPSSHIDIKKATFIDIDNDSNESEMDKSVGLTEEDEEADISSELEKIQAQNSRTPSATTQRRHTVFQLNSQHSLHSCQRTCDHTSGVSASFDCAPVTENCANRRHSVTFYSKNQANDPSLDRRKLQRTPTPFHELLTEEEKQIENSYLLEGNCELDGDRNDVDDLENQVGKLDVKIDNLKELSEVDVGIENLEDLNKLGEEIDYIEDIHKQTSKSNKLAFF